ncbi:MAG: DEAD/DEAH box helicase family protein [Staphylothermus sp.]|nr:DEAD/DEAH box helicase family protein [Staphylothermus sp.]
MQYEQLVSYIFNLFMKYNPAMRFYHYSEVRPLPIEPFLHQVEVLARCMLRDPIRILIGDEIGLGKTITAIAMGKYLEETGRVKRILVLVPRILVPQWVEELGYWVQPSRVNQLESYNVDLYKRGVPEGWYVASMDLVTRNKKVREVVLGTEWDLVIVDEAHKISPGTARMRWKYIGEELIAKHPERNVFLLSATPHKGFPDDYIARLRILDPNLKPDVDALDNKNFYKLTWNTLVFRRTKRDVNDIYEKTKVFVPAHLQAVLIKPTELEAEFYKEAERFLRNLLAKYKIASNQRSPMSLLATLLAKRTFSSPLAASSTLFYMTVKRIELLRKINEKEATKKANVLRNFIQRHLAEEYTEEDIDISEGDKIVLKEITGAPEPSVDDVLNAFATYASVLLDEDDVERMKRLLELAEKVRKEGDSKLTKLLKLVEYHVGEGSKIVIFTEYADTAYYIAENLRKVFGNIVKVLTGREAHSRKERKDVLDNFVKGNKYKVLVSTDVLSEGLNLQVANVLINYDLPWTPLKLEQRIGRIWRLGQQRECYIYMLVVGSSEKTTGASRVVSKLYTKLLNMGRALRNKINPILGEDVEVYVKDLSKKDRREYRIFVAEKKAGKGRRGVSETEIVLNSLDDKKFEYFVRWYLNTVKQIEKRLANSSVEPHASPSIVKYITEIMGFESREELKKFLLELTRSLASHKGVLEQVSEGREIIRDSFYQRPLQEMTARELVGVIQNLCNNLGSDTGRLGKLFKITVFGNNTAGKVSLVKVALMENGNTVYEAIMGVDNRGGEGYVMNSVEILRLLGDITTKFYQVSSHVDVGEIDTLWIKSRISTYLSKLLFARGLKDMDDYTKKVSEMSLRSGDEWNKVREFNEVVIKIEPIGIIELHKGLGGYFEHLIGEYDEKKTEIEDEAIAILAERLSSRFNIHDMHKVGAPFDVILIGKNGSESPEHRIVEVKSWKHIDVVIYTENEVGFAEENEQKGGNYWLYVVDMRGEKPKIYGYRRPFSTNALKLIAKIRRNGKVYYIYKVVRKEDEAW